MNNKLAISTVGHTASLFLAISFALCVGFDLLFPSHSMHESWQGFLPGFTWLSTGSFFLGLLESYAYGWYIAVLWVPLRNYFAGRAAK